MHSIPCMVGKSSSMTHTEQGIARGLPPANGWTLGYCAQKLQTGEFLLVTYADKAKTPKNNLLDAKCFMQQEGKLKFQTVAKKCGCITEKW